MAHRDRGRAARSRRAWRRPTAALPFAAAPVLLLLLAAAQPAFGQAPDLSLDTGGREWIRPEGPLTILAGGHPAVPGNRLAVIVGSADVTALFEAVPGGLAFRPGTLPLPSGESDLALYEIGPGDGWTEIGRFPLRVLTKGGFARAESGARVDIAVRSRLDESHHPEAAAPEGTSGSDLNAQLDARGALERDGWQLDAGANLIGVTHRPEALRFAEKGDEASRVDLSGYSLRLARGRGWIQLGAVTAGASRHLIENFSSRGAQLHLPLGSRADLSLAVVNGSQIVGWNNPLGLARSAHQVRAGTIGLEMQPSRPGALRFETTFLDGSLLPIAGYRQGVVNDAETSRGLGFRLLASTPSGRLRLVAGLARSRFDSPDDPALSRGERVVAVDEETRGARYLDLDVDLVRTDAAGRFATNVTLALRHDRVDPLYRSVAAWSQADRESNSADLRAAVGPIALSLAHARGRDNLDRIPSILTTKTRRWTGSLAVPLAQALGASGRGAAWLPLLSYTRDRTHQFGLGVPPDSDFAEPHVPDQVSLVEAGALDWQMKRWRVGYRFGESRQDNRQTGRERADFATRTHAGALGFSPHERVDLGLDLSSESSRSREAGVRDRTVRYGLSALWRPVQRATFNLIASRTDGADRPRTRRSESTLVDLTGTVRLIERTRGKHGLSGQAFLRYQNHESRSRDSVFDLDDRRRGWTLTSGVSLSVF